MTAFSFFRPPHVVQPKSFTKVAREWADGLLVAPLMSVASPLNLPNMVGGTALTISGAPTLTSTPTPLGIGYQCHPGGGSSGATNVSWLSQQDLNDIDFTALWVGRTDNVSGNGQLMARGDTNGAQDSVRLVAVSAGTVRFSYIDSSPAGFDLDVSEPTVAAGSMQRFAITKRGNVRSLYSWNSKTFGTQTSGLATMRAGGLGWLIGAAAGHAATVAMYVWTRAYSADICWKLLANPWQVWAPNEYPIATPDTSVPQVGYPIADIATNSWTNEAGGLPLYPSLADGGTGVADDATFAQSPPNPTTQYMEELLTSLLTPVAGAQGIKYRLRAVGQATHFVVDVRQGSTSLHVFTHDLTVAQGWQEFTQTVTAVTNYADARVRITASAP